MIPLYEKNETYYINSSSKTAISEFKILASKIINDTKKYFEETIILCIGTDRATGDSLGPLIGYKLSKFPSKNLVHVYGTLKEPVHAKNLDKTVEKIYKNHRNPMVIAIDASLGSTNHIGYLTIGKGSIKPGAGVRKNLKEVGNIFITGIVNLGGLMEMTMLQNTRLSIVMDMADIISTGLWLSL